MLDTFWLGPWKLEIDEVRGKWSISNPGPNDEKQLYEVVPGAQGEPIINAEPDLAFDAPANLRYINVRREEIKPDQKISGIVCHNGPRGSLTNLKKLGHTVERNQDGSLQIGGEKWWIITLFLKDKDCFRGYDAFCAREPLDEVVSILEFCDLDIFLC